MTTVFIDQRSNAVAPDRSLTQRLDALERANSVRTRRSQLKRDVKAGRVSVIDLLTDPPEFIETMKVYDLLLAVPMVATVKANQIVTRCRISPSKTIGGLSERQRDELTRFLLSRPKDKVERNRQYRELQSRARR